MKATLAPIYHHVIARTVEALTSPDNIEIEANISYKYVNLKNSGYA